MKEVLIVIVGLLVGAVGNIPALLLCHAARKHSYANMFVGIVVLLVSFLFFTVALLLVFKSAPEQFLSFSIACLTSFLFVFSLEAVLTFKWMSATQKGLKKRKAEENE